MLLQSNCHISKLNSQRGGRAHRPATNLRPTQLVWRSTACVVHASHWQQLPQQGSALQQRNVQRAKLWDLLDIGASLGAVSAAIAFVFTAEVMLAGKPVVLPLVAMYASRQRQRLQAEVRQGLVQGTGCMAPCQYTFMTPFPMHWTCCGRLQGATALSACSTCPSPDRGGFLKVCTRSLLQFAVEEAHVATGHSFPACSQAAVQAAALQIQQAAFQGQQEQQAQLDQVAALLRELQERLLVQQQLPARQFRSLEGKLGALEGSVLSAGGARLQHSPTLLTFRNARVCSLISISPPQQGTWSPS